MKRCTCFRWTVPLIALVLSEYAQADIDCSQSFLVTKAEDAEKLGSACKKLLGNLSISGYTQDKNLDFAGLEFVGGSVKFVEDACTEDAPCDPEGDMFDVTFPDLRTVEWDIDLSVGSDSLHTISFPKLRLVNGTVDSGSSPVVNLRALEYIGALSYFPYDGGKVRLDSLKGFARPVIGSGFPPVYGEDIGYFSTSSAKDANNLFDRDMEVIDEYRLPSIFLALVGRDDPENDYNVTIGWSRVDKIETTTNQFHGNYHIEFGQSSKRGQSAETIEVNKLIYSGGKGWITKNPNLKSLKVKEFELQEVEILDRNETIINTPRVRKMPFDDLGMLRIRGFRSQLIELPESALGWSNFSLVMERDCLDKPFNLTAYDEQDGGRQVWYWPETMQQLSVEGSTNMWTSYNARWQDSFLETFNDNNTRVLNSFKIVDSRGDVNCDELLKERGERLPELAECIAASAGYQNYPSLGLKFCIAAVTILAVML